MKSKITAEILEVWKNRYLDGETARSIWQDYKDICSESTLERKIREMGISRGKGTTHKIEINRQNIINDFLTGNFYCYELAKKI